MENRFDNHKKRADLIRHWIPDQPFGLTLFPQPPEFASNTVSCIKHDPKLDKAKLKEGLREKGFLFDGGYRKMADEGIPTFRIPTMGDLPMDILERYLSSITELMKAQA